MERTPKHPETGVLLQYFCAKVFSSLGGIMEKEEETKYCFWNAGSEASGLIIKLMKEEVSCYIPVQKSDRWG